jgi:hypothetical protein
VFPRVKEIAGRRYVYLVEGAREGRSVRQKTLCYLGPLSRLASGVPERTKKKVEETLEVDWGRVDQTIRKIPLTFEELSAARRERYVLSIRERRKTGPTSVGYRPRAEGELSALSKIAGSRFKELFEEEGERAYRMR